MKKRPLSIVIVAVFYFLEPFGNLIQAAYINQLPLFGEESILSSLLWSDWIILALFPVVGVGIYLVKKWGWYLFLSFSALLIFYNIFVYKYLNPNYSLETVLLFILTTTAISAFFLRKNVYAPYFNPRLRWWENATRYRSPLNTVLFTNQGAVPCKTLDISETGCFVNYHEEMPLDSQVMIGFHYDGEDISCMGKVVHHRSETDKENQGYGIMFQAMPVETKKRIRQLLWYFERIGLKDRNDAKIPARAGKEIPWQDYTVIDQMAFKVKIFLKTAMGTT